MPHPRRRWQRESPVEPQCPTVLQTRLPKIRQDVVPLSLDSWRPERDLRPERERSATSAGGGSTPTTTVDVTGVRNDLLALANAERQYWASNAKYASLDELQSGGGTHAPARQNYSYSVEAGETTFKVIATYSGPDPKAPKRIAIDETMTITSN